MRVERPAGAVLIEAGMFAAMAGVVATTALMVLADRTIIVAALLGGVVAAIVFVIMWLLLRGTMEPPRGPGNIAPSKTPLTTGSTSPAPTVPAAAMPRPAAPKPPAPATATTAAPQPAHAAEPADMAAPSKLDAPRDGSADDLKKIKGVGPKLEELLNSMGFYHFDQVANWSASEVAWVDENLAGFKGRVSRDDWVAQAKALASGHETEFSKRVDDGQVY